MAITKKASVASKPLQQKFTAKEFIDALLLFQSEADIPNIQRFFRDTDTGNKCLGVRWGTIFKLAKEFSAMDPKEISKLLDSKYYEVRMGAVCIMDYQARNKKSTDARKKELYDLYIKRHNRINNWDLVDRSAAFVVGAYLIDKPRNILYKLAKSKNVWERRTAIVSTYFFIRQGETADTFKIAEMLLNDEHDLTHKAAGSWLRFAGGKDSKALTAFLDKHAAKMPRAMLRNAIEKMDKKKREFYLNKK
jgi:3-methyladenine DNA glycosylase AlkD